VTFCICKNVPAVCNVETTTPSNFYPVYYNHSEIQNIPVSLDTILKNSGLPRIDLMVLEHERNVLNSFSFDCYG
jgi:hypothetical protein